MTAVAAGGGFSGLVSRVQRAVCPFTLHTDRASWVLCPGATDKLPQAALPKQRLGARVPTGRTFKIQIEMTSGSVRRETPLGGRPLITLRTEGGGAPANQLHHMEGERGGGSQHTILYVVMYLFRGREMVLWQRATPIGPDWPLISLKYDMHCKKCYVKSTKFCCLYTTKIYE